MEAMKRWDEGSIWGFCLGVLLVPWDCVFVRVVRVVRVVVRFEV